MEKSEPDSDGDDEAALAKQYQQEIDEDSASDDDDDDETDPEKKKIAKEKVCFFGHGIFMFYLLLLWIRLLGKALSYAVATFICQLLD